MKSKINKYGICIIVSVLLSVGVLLFEIKELNLKSLREIPIFFAIDDGYIPFLAVTLQSVIENANKNYKYAIRILNTNVKKENVDKITKKKRDKFISVCIRFGKVKNYTIK